MAHPRPTSSRRRKAKHAANQAALDRLSDLHQTTQSQTNSKYVHAIKRAMDSLQASDTAIATRRQAVDLKFVGPKLAQLICPNEGDTDESTTTTITTSSSDQGKKNTSRARRPLPTTTTASACSRWIPPPIAFSAKEQAYVSAQTHASNLILPQGPWKVILLLDGREHKAQHVQAKLQMSGVPCEQRMLPIGDMAWMAQCTRKTTNDQEEVVELMLGTIVERKEVNDLASSLFGTRYLEQRLRLVQCGLPQLLLLVEGDTHAVRNCPADTLHMAMMETRVHLNFHVVQTEHLDGTVRFLKQVHRRILQRAFPSAFADESVGVPSFASPTCVGAARSSVHKRRRKKQSLADLTFDTPPVFPRGMDDDATGNLFVTYQELKAKVEWDRERGTRTMGAMHMAMLKQIPSLSHKKVQALGQAYPTPSSLLEAYEPFVEENDETGISLLQELVVNTQTSRESRMGPKSAAEVYHCMTEGGTKRRVTTTATTPTSSNGTIHETRTSSRMAESSVNEPKGTHDDDDRKMAATSDDAPSPQRGLPGCTDDTFASLSPDEADPRVNGDQQVARDAAFAASLALADDSDDDDLEFDCSAHPILTMPSNYQENVSPPLVDACEDDNDDPASVSPALSRDESSKVADQISRDAALAASMAEQDSDNENFWSDTSTSFVNKRYNGSSHPSTSSRVSLRDSLDTTNRSASTSVTRKPIRDSLGTASVSSSPWMLQLSPDDSGNVSFLGRESGSPRSPMEERFPFLEKKNHNVHCQHNESNHNMDVSLVDLTASDQPYSQDNHANKPKPKSTAMWTATVTTTNSIDAALLPSPPLQNATMTSAKTAVDASMVDLFPLDDVMDESLWVRCQRSRTETALPSSTSSSSQPEVIEIE